MKKLGLMSSGLVGVSMLAVLATGSVSALANTSSTSNATTNSQSVAMTGFTVDRSWNKVGDNTASVEVSQSGNKSINFSATVSSEGNTYVISGVGRLSTTYRKPLYVGEGQVILNGQPQDTHVVFEIDPNSKTLDITGQDLQFVDGVVTPSYSEGYSFYKTLHQGPRAVSKGTASSSTLQPNTTITGGGSSDPNVLGQAYGGGTNTNLNQYIPTYMQVVGLPSIKRGAQNLYATRVWLSQSVPQSGYGTNIEEVDFSQSTGSSYVGENGIYPQSAGSNGTWSVSISVAYHAVSFSFGYSAGSVFKNTSNATNWSETQDGSWDANSNVYTGDSTQNGLGYNYWVYASSTMPTGTYTGSASANIMLTNYGTYSTYSYWCDDSCNWTYSVVS